MSDTNLRVKSNSLFLNILFQYIVVILVLTFSLSIFYYQMIKKDYLSNLKDELRNNLLIVTDLIIDDYLNENYNLLNGKISSLGKKINKRLTVIRMDGTVISDSEEDYTKMENHSERPEIIAAYNGNLGESIRFSNTLKLNMLYIAMPIMDRDNIIGVLRISYWLKDIKDIIRIYQLELIIEIKLFYKTLC